MAILVCRNNTGTNGDIDTYDPLSSGDNSDPLSATVVLDGTNSPTYIESTPQQLYLVATQHTYTGITVEIINDTVDIDWLVSLDNASYTDSVTPTDMDASVTDVVTSIYFKVKVKNDGTVTSQNFTTPKIRITATEV
jgi:hypothetical protein